MPVNVNNQTIENAVVYFDTPSWFAPEMANQFSQEPAAQSSIQEMMAIKATAIEFVSKFNVPLFSSEQEPATMERETGDDKFMASQDPYILALSYSVTKNVLKMELSEPDTFISSEFWDFCSTIGKIPTAFEQSFNYCRKTNSMATLGFWDVFPLKMALDTSPSVDTFGSTAVGKTSWFGYRKDTCRKELLGIQNVLSFIQDGYLRTDKMKDPKYIIPRCAGGLAVTNLFNKESNGYSYIKVYKTGTYERVYGTAIEELIHYLNRIDDDLFDVQTPLICSLLREKQDYLHGTYDNRVYVKDRETDLPEPLYKGLRDKALLHTVEERLLNARILIGRRAANVEIERSRRLNAILFSNDTLGETQYFKEVDRDLRKNYEGALQANTAFQRLLDRSANHHDAEQLLKDGFNVSHNGVKRFERRHAKFLHCKDKRLFTLRDIYIPEDMFFRDEVSVETSLKVGGIELTATEPRGVVTKLTTSQLGLWKISETMLEWCAGKRTELKLAETVWNRPIPYQGLLEAFSTNLEWVNDDLGLIAQSFEIIKELPKRSSFLWLVTDDAILAYKMQRSVGIPIARISPDLLVQQIQSIEDIPHITAEWFMATFPYNTKKYRRSGMLPIDTGSIASALVRRDKDNLYRRNTIVATSQSRRGVRTVSHDFQIVDYKPAKISRFYD